MEKCLYTWWNYLKVDNEKLKSKPTAQARKGYCETKDIYCLFSPPTLTKYLAVCFNRLSFIGRQSHYSHVLWPFGVRMEKLTSCHRDPMACKSLKQLLSWHSLQKICADTVQKRRSKNKEVQLISLYQRLNGILQKSLNFFSISRKKSLGGQSSRANNKMIDLNPAILLI